MAYTKVPMRVADKTHVKISEDGVITEDTFTSWHYV